MADAVAPDLRARQVPPGLFEDLAERARSRGLDPAPALRAAGVDPARPPAEGRFSYRDFVAFLTALEALAPGPDFFLTHGRDFEFTDYGLLGYAMMSAATMGQAIQIAVRYHRTVGPLVQVSMESDEELVWVRLDNLFGLDDPVLRVVVENIVSTFPPLVAQLTGRDGRPERLLLSYPAPADAGPYREVFGCEPEFGAERTRYGIAPAVLARPVLRADPDAAQLLEVSCQELLREVERQDTLTNRIRAHLLANPGSPLDAPAVARAMAISERGLRRHLRREGTSFQAVLDDVRRRMAQDYLASTTLSIQQIAELVGFSEATNFRRAFLRWTGTSPHRFRRDAA